MMLGLSIRPNHYKLTTNGAVIINSDYGVMGCVPGLTKIDVTLPCLPLCSIPPTLTHVQMEVYPCTCDMHVSVLQSTFHKLYDVHVFRL